MRNSVLRVCMVCLIILLSAAQTAFAAVYTENRSDGIRKGIYVAGNPDFYPVEYYNKETEQFEGIMPEILKSISESTGLDFTYLSEKGVSQTELAENLQAELVSAYLTDSGESYAADDAVVFSYTYKGKDVNIGWAFTSICDKAVIQALKAESLKITEKDISGYLISLSQTSPQNKAWQLIALLAGCVLLVVLAVLLLLVIKSTRKQLKENKMTDAETGIGNLAYFDYCFNAMISDISRSLYYIAYIIIDSSYVQLYHGETAFIDFVKYTAGILNSYEKENEFSARITENGFAFAFQSTNEGNAKQMLEEITGKLNLYIQEENKTSRPFCYAAVYNLNQSDRSCELLLFNLRKNCNKLIGSDIQIIVCDTRMMNSAAIEKQTFEQISRGFENQEFKLYLQFIVDNKTKKIVSAEALSRWDNPERGLLLPGEYIGAMETSGFISHLDYYMFEMSCRLLHKWRNTEFGGLTISCNFTRITISEENFTEKIKEISSKYIFEKSQLVLEITEDSMEKNRDTAMHNILECKKMGFKIALDDMGSGHTSLINLCEYPIDIVKIDRDILLKTEKKNGMDLFVGIIALAHSLGLKTVCEGVETKEQNRLIDSTDCDYIQGWYYSRAFPEREGEEFIRKYSEKSENTEITL